MTSWTISYSAAVVQVMTTSSGVVAVPIDHDGQDRAYLSGEGMTDGPPRRREQCLKPVDGVGRGVPSRVSSEGQVKRGSR